MNPINAPETVAFIAKLTAFIKQRVPFILAKLQEMRFANQGQFNDHARWADNDPEVKYEKYDAPPLVETGELRKELTDPKNWENEFSIKYSDNKLSIDINTTEDFTDSKYDKQDTGGEKSSWRGMRTGKLMTRTIKARPFKDLSDQDIQWVRDRLEEDITNEFTS